METFSTHALNTTDKAVDKRPDRLLVMHSMVGHLIRRAKQKSTLTFAPITRNFNLTPVQYAVLEAIASCPAVDQAALGDIVELDTSTIGQVIARLEQRGLVTRRPEGRRLRVEVSDAGGALLEQVRPLLEEIQLELTAPLTAKERKQLLRLMSKMLGVSNLYYQPRARARRKATRTRR